MLKHFVVVEEGQTLVEYSLVIGLIALVMVMVLTFLGARLRAGFSEMGNSISTGSAASPSIGG